MTKLSPIHSWFGYFVQWFQTTHQYIDIYNQALASLDYDELLKIRIFQTGSEPNISRKNKNFDLSPMASSNPILLVACIPITKHVPLFKHGDFSHGPFSQRAPVVPGIHAH